MRLPLWLRRRSEVGLEEVVRPERDKGIPFFLLPSHQDFACSSGETVIADAGRHTLVPFERLALSLKERHPPLRRECHHERLP